MTPYRSGPITAVFDLTGIAEVIAPISRACGWGLDVIEMPVPVAYDGGGATLVRGDSALSVDPFTGSWARRTQTTRYRLGLGATGAARTEACRNRSPNNACHVHVRTKGTEMHELLSAEPGR